MLFQRRSPSPRSFLLTSLLILLGLASSANAASVTATATSANGQPISGSLTIDDGIDPGNLVITLTLDVLQGDVRGFLAQIADESLISGLEVVGLNGRSTQFRQNKVGSSIKARGLGASGVACPCDLGVKFPAQTGTSVTFTLTHETEDLTIALFYGQDFAIKASRVRLESSNGQGRSKGIKNDILLGRVPNPVPEPTTALLMALGLGGLSYAGRGAKR